MARVKLSEHTAKSLLADNYVGIPLFKTSLEHDSERLDPTTPYIIKVDQGIKKRGKQGLIRLNITKDNAIAACNELTAKGFERFIAEPMVEHSDDEERYVSFERTRDAIKITYSEHGGVDIEEHPGSVHEYTIDSAPLPKQFIEHIVSIMDKEHLGFVEINPLIIRDNECILLDAAVLADSAGEFQASWTDDDIVEAHTPQSTEAAIAELNNNSPAAFSFRILNPNGALWLLLSGGGASITLADEASNKGKADCIGNYGEYSGGPSTEETYLYTCEVLKAAFASTAPKKAIIIAGGVANFTDVKKTFIGVIRALNEHISTLQSQGFTVFVRRGGPNETEGLALMEDFLRKNNIFGSIHGSSDVLTTVIHEALEVIDA